MEGDAPSPEEVIERGWVRGLREAGAVLEHLLGAAAANGSAFAATWPYVGGEEWLAAPGVPAVVTAEAQDAIDGVYRLSTDGVLREAAGEERLLLSTTGPPEASPERPFDLLWFSTSARYLLRDGVIEAEDPFCRVRAPAGRDRLETLLVRAQRVDAAILEGLGLEAGARPATLEVRRALALTGQGWRDHERVLGRREDVRTVEPHGQELLLRLEGGGEVVASVAADGAGWVAEFGPGFPWTRAEMAAEERTVAYRVTLIPELDPLAPGVRTRLAFDLLSDLLGLENGG
jgi:hypothetical protein